MTFINILGVEFVLLVIFIVGIIVLLRNIVYGSGSLRDHEIIHRVLIMFGGMLIGAGIAAQIIVPNSQVDRQNWIDDNFSSSDLINSQFFFGLLLVFAGVIVIILSGTYLRSVLWKPLEDVSEYSSEFGKSFLATRLPLSGGKELQAFSERFNQNVLEIANKLSKFEIQMEFLEESIERTVNAGLNLSNETTTLKEYASNYSSLSLEQNSITRDIETEVNKFIAWYNTTQASLNEHFVDIRAIAELGNLIAVNAAIESSNLDVPNPGFETIAEKLHELAKSLEQRQDSLRLLVNDITMKYDDFSNNVLKNIKSSVEKSEDSTRMASDVEDILYRLKQNETSLITSSDELGEVMSKVQTNIPRSY